jgi:hypothetical protein
MISPPPQSFSPGNYVEPAPARGIDLLQGRPRPDSNEGTDMNRTSRFRRIPSKRKAAVEDNPRFMKRLIVGQRRRQRRVTDKEPEI